MYSTCQSKEEIVFNAMLRSMRNIIECAFGQLNLDGQEMAGANKKNGFQTCEDSKFNILIVCYYHVVYELSGCGFESRCSHLIYSCFVLHNFCERHNAYISEE